MMRSRALVAVREAHPGVPTIIPPVWATDDDATIPLGAFRDSAGMAPLFTIGELVERHAIIRGETRWRHRGILETHAQEAWKLLTEFDCDKRTARAIADGWRLCWQRQEH